MNDPASVDATPASGVTDPGAAVTPPADPAAAVALDAVLEALLLVTDEPVPTATLAQVAGQATIGTTARFEGIILSQTGITLQTGATMNGRALAQSLVALDSATVTRPAP